MNTPKEKWPTFEEKKDNDIGLTMDRQNTKWWHEIMWVCDHHWQPVTITPRGQFGPQPDLINATVYCVCMKCRAWTTMQAGYCGFTIGGPDELEEEG